MQDIYLNSIHTYIYLAFFDPKVIGLKLEVENAYLQGFT